MYTGKHFTGEEMMKYEMIPNDDKNDWAKNLAYFTNLYTIRKACSEDRAEEIGFESAANVTHIAPPASINNASLNMNIGGTMGSITPTQEDEAAAEYNYYVEGMEESLKDAK